MTSRLSPEDAARHAAEQVVLRAPARARAAAKESSIHSSLLIHRLDIEAAYYLVSWREPSGRETVVAAIEADSGELLEVAVHPRPISARRMTPAEARNAVARKLPEVTIFGEPRLVWQPCRQTFDMLSPMFELGTERGQVFVTLDGTVHVKLDRAGKGG